MVQPKKKKKARRRDDSDVTRVHHYNVRLLPWTITLTKDQLSVKALWGTTRVPRSRIVSIGIASDSHAADTIASLRGARERSVRVASEGTRERLPHGPLGLVVVYEVEGGESDVAFTFEADDDEAVAIVEDLLSDPEIEFSGIDETIAIRARMGRGGGDILWGFVLFVVLLIVAMALTGSGCL